MLKNCWNLQKVRMQSVTTSNGGVHTCACAPKSGRARCVHATQKKVATHPLHRWLDIYKMWFHCNPLHTCFWTILSYRLFLEYMYSLTNRWELGHVVCSFNVEDYQIMIGVLKIWLSFTSLDQCLVNFYLNCISFEHFYSKQLLLLDYWIIFTFST